MIRVLGAAIHLRYVAHLISAQSREFRVRRNTASSALDPRSKTKSQGNGFDGIHENPSRLRGRPEKGRRHAKKARRGPGGGRLLPAGPTSKNSLTEMTK
jgi:hypothetical protein